MRLTEKNRETEINKEIERERANQDPAACRWHSE